ncbi:uncharacterized protein LOC119324318 [Triticum dicoccoides]|uniref:uncharacterized protein LOC119324318 n=1 Tax=Triticum dicoccoides TaxID=85692 RepID=UPI000E7AD660|nr:uncharacterized protein LOC119324318 [Triticum dicoccoides]
MADIAPGSINFHRNIENCVVRIVYRVDGDVVKSTLGVVVSVGRGYCDIVARNSILEVKKPNRVRVYFPNNDRVRITSSEDLGNNIGMFHILGNDLQVAPMVLSSQDPLPNETIYLFTYKSFGRQCAILPPGNVTSIAGCQLKHDSTTPAEVDEEDSDGEILVNARGKLVGIVDEKHRQHATTSRVIRNALNKLGG